MHPLKAEDEPGPGPIIDTKRLSLARFASQQPRPNVFEEMIFKDCLLYGPAILWPIDKTRFTTPWFEPYSREGLFWHVGPEREFYIGEIQASNCRFENCRFEGVGIACDDEAIQLFSALIETSMGLDG